MRRVGGRELGRRVGSCSRSRRRALTRLLDLGKELFAAANGKRADVWDLFSRKEDGRWTMTIESEQG